MNLPCTNPCVSCPPTAGSDGRVPIFPDPNDPFNPFVNISSEAPDRPIYIGTNGNNPGGGDPPLGSQWTAQGCLTTCVSTVSQQDANECAQRQNILCLSDDWPETHPNPNPNPPPPGFPPSPPTVTSPRPVFANTQQSCDFICPDGTPFTYTIAAGTFFGFSVEYANSLAHIHACNLAIAGSLCMGALIPSAGCLSQEIACAATISAQRSIVELAIISGALPPGTGLAQSQEGFVITGTPTAIGSYSFTIHVADEIGNFMNKQYTIVIEGVTTDASAVCIAEIGSPYSVTITAGGTSGTLEWSIISGSLPPGLTLNSSTGEISGTPTTQGTYTFTIGYTDER